MLLMPVAALCAMALSQYDLLERLAPENTLNLKNCRRVIKLTHSWPLRQSSLRRMRPFWQRSSPKS